MRSTATLPDARILTPVHSRTPLTTHQQVVAPSLRVGDGPAAAVFAAARRRGPIARDAIATLTSLSIATVNRQVTALLDAGLLRERADRLRSYAS